MRCEVPIATPCSPLSAWRAIVEVEQTIRADAGLQCGERQSGNSRVAVAEMWLPLVVVLMELLQNPGPAVEVFSAFVGRVEPGLRQALVATYGPVDGREATVEALSWAWENWERLAEIDNQAGYLYRVGQTSTRRFTATAVPHGPVHDLGATMPDVEPGLLPALEMLSVQQRSVVLLVHAHGWSQADVARMLDINPSTVREHLARAMKRLRNELETHDED